MTRCIPKRLPDVPSQPFSKLKSDDDDDDDDGIELMVGRAGNEQRPPPQNQADPAWRPSGPKIDRMAKQSHVAVQELCLLVRAS